MDLLDIYSIFYPKNQRIHILRMGAFLKWYTACDTKQICIILKD